jgi:hypothetical protein
VSPGAVELEIGVHRTDSSTWTIELRGSVPKEDVDIRVVRPTDSPDLAALRQLVADDRAYGRLLTDGLFGNPDIREQFGKALAAANAQDLPLRIRLFIGPSAPDLHDLHWETLQDPESYDLLLTNERVLFSRYLSSLDWRAVTVRPKAQVTAVLAIANPTGLASWRADGRELAPIDVEVELARATSALGRVKLSTMASGGTATLDNIDRALREGPDILYLICHGFVAKGEAQLLLEDQTGAVVRVPASALVKRVSEMRHPPSLVVLASCQSAGAGDDVHSEDRGALAALGPQLAEAGVPAVVAMQGNISMATSAAFVTAFFKELHRDGQIDRAVAVARSVVQARPDWWIPVLFMRLKSGRIWYKPGFAAAFEKWPAVLRDIRAIPCKCTPILGPGLTDALLGTRHELAQRWASTYHFPMAPHERDDLPQVAQYLAVSQNDRFPREGLLDYMRQELVDRYGEGLTDEVRKGTLEALLSAVGTRFRSEGVDEPHSVLARLPFPVFVTAHPTNLLASALEAEGKRPEVELCRWRDTSGTWAPESIYAREPGYRPDPARPLVFHLFGHLREPDSLVVTEDDYLDFLITLTSNKDLIPSVVRRALTDTSLMFLGFRMDEWEFRVLFRSLMNQEGQTRRHQYSHVAVQIDPEGSQTLEPERARRYLQQYFGDVDINIYWGSVEDFMRELGDAWKAGLS